MPSMASQVAAAAETSGTLKQVQLAFTTFQVARNQFINSVQGFLGRRDNNVTLEALMKADILAVLCCPLAHDPVAGIQESGLRCLAKLAAADPTLSQAILSCGVLDSILVSLAHSSPAVQVAACAALQALASSGPEQASVIVQVGAIESMKALLESTSAEVCTAAVRSITAAVGSGEATAAEVVDSALLCTLVALLLAPASPKPLCHAIILCLSTICEYNASLAAAVMGAGGLKPLSAAASRPPGKLSADDADAKADALMCLSHISKHDAALAASVRAHYRSLMACRIGRYAETAMLALHDLK